jgi:hypothetical protein
MTKASEVIVSLKCAMTEAAYPGNIGFHEMVKFYQVASHQQIEAMETVIKNSDWSGFKSLINKVLKVKLQ